MNTRNDMLISIAFAIFSGPLACASDFPEAIQDTPNSAFHISMLARDNARSEAPASVRVAHQAHVQCVFDAAYAGRDIVTVCAKTRAILASAVPARDADRVVADVDAKAGIAAESAR